MSNGAPWGRLALLSQDEVGWAYFVEQLLVGQQKTKLTEAALLEACRIDSAKACSVAC